MNKIIWEELYQDLSPAVAQALRDARVKPEKLPVMSDDEIMAIPGMTETGLEEIRGKYEADIQKAQELATTKTPAKEPTNQEVAPQSIANKPANKRHLFKNGKAIREARSKIEPGKAYPVLEAVKLVQENTIAKFDATLTLHLNLVNTKERLTRAEVIFPHLAGESKRVVIATDEVISNIDKGILDFDILITTPQMMPKLAKYARILGPKGLMPNPKNGTVTTDPEGKKKEFEAGKTVIKAEPKFPLMHVTVGKKSQKAEEIAANIMAVIEAVKTKNITKATLASSMSPGVRIQI